MRYTIKCGCGWNPRGTVSMTELGQRLRSHLEFHHGVSPSAPPRDGATFIVMAVAS